ncbi:hypothetical protein, partial [Victivallis vadensis]|uniref:hypothetical protein n=1 Tax=Victivallis vadensis TaxID=172901 RepID=UPI003AF9B400
DCYILCLLRYTIPEKMQSRQAVFFVRSGIKNTPFPRFRSPEEQGILKNRNALKQPWNPLQKK